MKEGGGQSFSSACARLARVTSDSTKVGQQCAVAMEFASASASGLLDGTRVRKTGSLLSRSCKKKCFLSEERGISASSYLRILPFSKPLATGLLPNKFLPASPHAVTFKPLKPLKCYVETSAGISLLESLQEPFSFPRKTSFSCTSISIHRLLEGRVEKTGAF